MNVTREVILDLFPIYLAGEASPATRTLVEEFLKKDTELAQRLRLQCADQFATALPTTLPPELELRSLRRTRGLLKRQSWLLGAAIGFIAFACSFVISFKDGHTDMHFLFSEYPPIMVTLVAAGLSCSVAYWIIRRKLRVGD